MPRHGNSPNKVGGWGRGWGQDAGGSVARGRGVGGADGGIVRRRSTSRPRNEEPRKRLRRSSSVAGLEVGLSQDAGGDLAIGPSPTGAAAASAANLPPASLVRASTQQTPAPKRGGLTLTAGGQQAQSITVTLTATSALELLQRLEGVSSEESLKLCNECQAFLLSNFEKVAQRETFLLLNLRRMEELIGSDQLQVSKEEAVLSAVMAWARHDADGRSQGPLVSTQAIRYGSISREISERLLMRTGQAAAAGPLSSDDQP